MRKAIPASWERLSWDEEAAFSELPLEGEGTSGASQVASQAEEELLFSVRDVQSGVGCLSRE